VSHSDSYLVRVKAVVMTRDDSSGGWLAQDGCLSRVGVCRVLSAELLGQRAFFIHGERLKDQQVGDLTVPLTWLGVSLGYEICFKSMLWIKIAVCNLYSMAGSAPPNRTT
jgi:hypothetical protein